MRFPARKCGIPYTWVPDRLGQSAIESTSSADGGVNSRVLLRKRCALTTRSAILPARLSSPALDSTGRENPGTFLRPSCQEVSIMSRATRGLIFISVGVDRDGQGHRILRA